MKNYLTAVFLCLGILSLSAQNIRFVKQGGTGTGIGSFANASGDLQAMMNQLSNIGGEVWVATGTYAPMRLANNYTVATGTSISPDNAFVLRPNVQVYGGFAGNEGVTEFYRRNPNTNPTILSGGVQPMRIVGSIIYPPVIAYHVVISAGEVGNAVLDGFTIQGGNAYKTGSYNVNGYSINRNTGGGICLFGSSPTLKHLKIMYNTASNNGGGIYAYMSNSAITNVLIKNNSASESSGGGLYSIGYDNTQILTNVEISNNYAAYGGGIAVIEMSLTLINNTIAGNNASIRGSGMYIDNYFYGTDIVKIRNSIIYGNIGSALKTYGINVTNCNYSLIEGLTAAGTNNNLAGSTNPLFVNVSSNDYSLSLSSPCIGKGWNSYNTTATDLAGNQRIRGYNIDLGAYESSNTTKSLSDRINNNYENILDEESSKIELSVYPNPINSNERINISLGNYYNPVTVGVYSLEGKLIHSKAYEGGDFKLDIPDLAPGMYLIHVQTQEGENFTRKIIVNK